MIFSYNLPQPCIPLYPRYIISNDSTLSIISIAGIPLSSYHFQLFPFDANNFLAPLHWTEKLWSILLIISLRSATATLIQVKSNLPLYYTEPEQLNVVGENTLPWWLPHLKFMAKSQPVMKREEQYYYLFCSPSLAHSLSHSLILYCFLSLTIPTPSLSHSQLQRK